MSLRALGSLLTRRFSPRGFPRTQAQAQAGSSPGMVSRRAAVGATAAFAGVVGFLYFKKDTTYQSAGEVTAEGITANAKEARKETPVSEAVKVGDDMNDAAVRAIFMDKDGKMRWLDYVDYLTFGETFGGVKDEEQVNDRDAVEEQEESDTVDEAAMTARFEEWMKEHDKTYRTKEETAMRYEMFKKTAKRAEKFNASKGTAFYPNGLADMTDEEYD